jgi:putative membrane protein
MILPGISGSFMLLLMGMYAPVLAAVKGFQVTELVVFALGCGVGLLSFARLLDRLLRAHRSMAMAFLCGVLLGSLVAVWPWRVSVILALGAEPVEVTRPVLPFDLPAPQLALCLLTFCAGIFTVWATQKIAGRKGG